MLPNSKNEVDEWCRENNLSHELFIEIDNYSITTLEEVYVNHKYNKFEILKDKINAEELVKFENAISKLSKNLKICNFKTRCLIFFSVIILFILFLYMLFDYVINTKRIQ